MGQSNLILRSNSKQDVQFAMNRMIKTIGQLELRIRVLEDLLKQERRVKKVDE